MAGCLHQVLGNLEGAPGVHSPTAVPAGPECPPAQDSSNIAYRILHRRAQEPSRKGAGRAKARRDGEACQAGRLPRAPCAPPRAARFAQLS